MTNGELFKLVVALARMGGAAAPVFAMPPPAPMPLRVPRFHLEHDAPIPFRLQPEPELFNGVVMGWRAYGEFAAAVEGNAAAALIAPDKTALPQRAARDEGGSSVLNTAARPRTRRSCPA